MGNSYCGSCGGKRNTGPYKAKKKADPENDSATDAPVVASDSKTPQPKAPIKPAKTSKATRPKPVRRYSIKKRS